MSAVHTSSDLEEDILDMDTELFNDLTSGTLAEDAGLQEIYYQTVITNRLLGLIVALVIVTMIFGLMNWIMKLVSDNITNQF